MSKLFGIVAIFALIGCASAPKPQLAQRPPVVDVQTRDVIVRVPCNVDVGATPTFPDTKEALLAAPHPDAEAKLMADPMDAEAFKQVQENLAYRTQLIASSWANKNARIATLEGALEACKKPVNVMSDM